MRGSVLIVDDDAAIREILAEALREEGYLVRSVDSCTGALSMLEQSRPSVILLDLMMPILGGWQFLEIVKSNKNLSAIPIVIITASDQAPREYKVLKKPFDLDQVLAVVLEICGPAVQSATPGLPG